MRQGWIAAAFVLAFALSAQAQTVVVNPTAVRFQSSDHNGDPLKRPTEYVVDFFQAGATEPTQSPFVQASAVTPVPNTTPQLYDITFAQLGGYPAGTTFTVKVRTRNSAGTASASNATDPFGLAVPPAAAETVTLVPSTTARRR